MDFQAANEQAQSLAPEWPSAVRSVLGEQHVHVRGRYPQRDAGVGGGAWSMNCARAIATLNEPFKAIPATHDLVPLKDGATMRRFALGAGLVYQRTCGGATPTGWA